MWDILIFNDCLRIHIFPDNAPKVKGLGTELRKCIDNGQRNAFISAKIVLVFVNLGIQSSFNVVIKPIVGDLEIAVKGLIE